MPRCTICGKSELLPFTCRNCGQLFCSEHRLPESHNCPLPEVKTIPMRRISNRRSGSIYARSSSFRTSRTELLHLAIGIAIIFIVEVPSFIRSGGPVLVYVACIIAVAFALHEVAHKLTAQYHGLWSEFRLDPLGTLISLLTALSPFKLLTPGAVVVFGFGVTKESLGKIALAGPLASIVQVLVYIYLSRFHLIFWVAAILNADLAIFNLIPASVLDGQKVFSWSKKAWSIAFVTSLILWIMLRGII